LIYKESSPEIGSEGRASGEVGELLTNAGEEEPCEAVSIDGWYA